MPTRDRSIDAVSAYHVRTKHHLHRFADSPGYLDWDTQPNPFRSFKGSDKVLLSISGHAPGVTYDDLYGQRLVPAAAFDLANVGILFELALGLSAWKEYGDTRWALRSNPSSGNLHPTEGYAILPQLRGLETAGVYHYLSHDHCLELRSKLAAPALIPQEACLVGFSSIHWREAWKYGERAFRYCQHDIGHAIAGFRYAAAVLGWSVRLLGRATDSEIADTLGLSRSESLRGVAPQDREHPGALLLVRRDPTTHCDVDLAQLRTVLTQGVWTGEANPLSPEHVEWLGIDEVAQATWREDRHEEPPTTPDAYPTCLRPVRKADAATLIRRRRSAVAFDDESWIDPDTFYGMLDRLLPRAGVPPWDVWPWPPRLHCAIFVHRVRALESGLYLLERSADAHQGLRAALRPDFVFERPADCPEHLRLFLLAKGDFRHTAEIVSCRQKIAGAGCFTLGMLAEFTPAIASNGAGWYRRMFWEAGLLGHVLYLEAEAAGVRGTGIGCYFDDAFHEILGIGSLQYQSLYHFTVGGPVEDTRLMTRPGYDHLPVSRRSPALEGNC